MQTERRGPTAGTLELQDERQPSGSEASVVLRWDGEPKTPEALLGRLNEYEAEVGLEADNLSLGGTVEKLEKRFCQLLGKEAASFMPTGTLANHLALRKLCGLKPRAIVQEQSHLYNDTNDCVTRLSGINLYPLARGRTCFSRDELAEALEQVSETGKAGDSIGAVMIESPVRNQRGQIVPYEEMKAITDLCRSRGISSHLDGARLYMMSAATGIALREYTALFDTVYVSMYKYFGATYGAILAGTSEFIKDMHQDRRMFGGSLASSYLAAALALKGVEGFEERFGAAMAKASELFARLNTLSKITVGKFEQGSNIFPVDLDPSVELGRLVSKLKEHWIFVVPDETDVSRVHFAVNTTILRQSNDQMFGAFEEALG